MRRFAEDRRGRWRAWAVAWLAVLAAQARGQPAGEVTDAALFQRVRAVFQAHCIECHGPRRASADLRLDTLEHAGRGGLSRQPVVGGTVETNELLRRVKSGDSDYRMPRRRPALKESDIQLLETWVRRGTPWPAPLAVEKPLLEKILDVLEHPLARYIYAAVAGLAGAWVLWRCRRSGRRAMAAGKVTPRWVAALARISFGWLAAMVLVSWLVMVWREGAALRDRIVQTTSPPGTEFTWQAVLGDPPAVIHLDHPPALRQTYYRGNCERSPQLFNNGVYRTCTIHVSVCDAAGRPLAWNDPLPQQGLAIRFEIERAPNATVQLFDDQIMSSVFLSAQCFSSTSKRRVEPIYRMKTIVPQERWAALATIAGQTDGVIAGRLYLHNGGPGEQDDDSEIASQCHFGVEYRIKLVAGRIAEGSEVWANAILIAGAVQWPGRFEPGKVVFHEWFDCQPIPVITGPNSTDPALLGVPEHKREKP